MVSKIAIGNLKGHAIFLKVGRSSAQIDRLTTSEEQKQNSQKFRKQFVLQSEKPLGKTKLLTAD